MSTDKINLIVMYRHVKHVALNMCVLVIRSVLVYKVAMLQRDASSYSAHLQAFRREMCASEN